MEDDCKKLYHPRDVLNFDLEEWKRILHSPLRHLASMLADMTAYTKPEWTFRPDLDHEHAHNALICLLLKETIRVDSEKANVQLAAKGRPLVRELKSAGSCSGSTSKSRIFILLEPTNSGI
jgi:hypothetical protein